MHLLLLHKYMYLMMEMLYSCKMNLMDIMHKPEEQSQGRKRLGSHLADGLQPGELRIPSEVERAKRRRMT